MTVAMHMEAVLTDVVLEIGDEPVQIDQRHADPFLVRTRLRPTDCHVWPTKEQTRNPHVYIRIPPGCNFTSPVNFSDGTQRAPANVAAVRTLEHSLVH